MDALILRSSHTQETSDDGRHLYIISDADGGLAVGGIHILGVQFLKHTVSYYINFTAATVRGVPYVYVKIKFLFLGIFRTEIQSYNLDSVGDGRVSYMFHVCA